MLIWLFLLIVPLLGGCWDQVELTERGFVMGMALDVADEGKIEMTVQLFRPMQATGFLSGDSKSGESYYNVQIVSDSVLEGIREIPARTGRKTQWSHQRILLISEEFVRTYPIQRFLDHFNRDLELRQLTNIAITQGKAGNYLEKQPVIELTTSQEFKSIQESAAKYSGKTINTRLLDINLQLSSETGNAIIPYLAKDEKSEDYYRIKGLAVLHKGKLKEVISPEQTEDLLMLLNKIHVSVIRVPCNSSDHSEGQLLESVQVLSLNSVMNVSPTLQRTKVNYTIDIDGQIGELHCTNLSTHQEEHKYVKKLTELIEARLQQLVKHLQSEQIDVLGIGNRIYQMDPGLWKQMKADWDDEYFSQVDFTFDINLTLRGFGLKDGTPTVAYE